MPHSTPGGRLVQARLSYGARLGRVVTLEEIAEELGVSGVTLGRWEKNQNEPDLPMFRRLAEIYGVSAGWLAFGEHTTKAQNGASINVPPEIIAPEVDRKLTADEVERARRIAAQNEAQRRAAAPKRKPGRGK